MARRRMWYRLLWGNSAPYVAAAIAEIVLTQSLEPTAVTSVLEVGLSGADVPEPLANGTALRLDQIDLISPNPDGHPYRRLFKGVVNRVTGVSSPRRVPITGDGPLARLKRCKPAADTLLSGSGKTDVDAKKTILTACGVPYAPADIRGWGVALGGVEGVWWRRDEYADRVIAELDRVYGTATIEVGEGRVAAFPYSKVPADYASGLYAGQDVQKTYVRGQASTRFLDNARDRGSTDEICNAVRIEGLSWRDGAGCTRQVWAEAAADHPLLGPGQRVGCDVAPSDLVQTEALAKAIARRTIRERNRTPDTERIRGANEAPVTVGDLVHVKDPVYGINLVTPATYLAVTTRREGDRMTVDGVGGAAGAVGTLTAGISRCCGTQRADGTCDDVGTDPDPIDPPDPGIPPDPGVDICPFEDATCEPVGGTPPVAPDEDEPFTGCTEDAYLTCPDDFAGTCHEATPETGSCTGGPAPADVCDADGWVRRDYSAGFASGFCDCRVHASLREADGDGHAYRATADGAVDAFTLCQAPEDPVAPLVATYRVSTVADPADGDAASDLTTTGAICVSFGYRFCSVGENIAMRLVAVDAGGNELPFTAHSLTLYADPGLSVGTGFGDAYVVSSATTHIDGAVWTGGAPPHVSLGLSYRNNGGFGPVGGLPIGEDGAAIACFEMAGQDPRAIWTTGAGAGYLQHLPYFDSENPLPGEPTHVSESGTHVGHRIEFRLESGASDTLCTDECPGPIVYDVRLGHSTCAENPDYVPPEGSMT